MKIKRLVIENFKSIERIELIEPNNGLHPQVAGELIDFFRIMCEERGHYIWLDTHSQLMARRVKPEEFVIVEKVQGATTVRQFKEGDFHGMRAD